LETSTNIAGLIAKYIAKQINEQEMEKLKEWIDCSESNRRIFEEVTDSEYAAANLATYRSIKMARAWQKMQPAPTSKEVKVFSIKKLLIAAAVSTGIFFLVYTLLPGDNKNENTAGQPGGHKALLTLADGAAYNLENWQTGVIARPGNYVITKLNDSTIRYEPARNEWSQSEPEQHFSTGTLHDTIATPRGGQYHIILPDGTDVLLNALSTLRIPVSFSPNRRMIEFSGEGFFKVNRSSVHHPSAFTVKLENSTIEVMGTQFNVKAYNDEDSVTTTVLEGKVKIKAGEIIELLTGNQQARVLKNDKIIKENADAYEAISWTTGLYQFTDQPLRLILNQACRWYDMEFELEQELTEVFTVWIEKDKPLSEFLDRLSGTRLVRFEVKGRKIIVHKADSQ
jgi:transmembrane sensor